MNQLDSQQLMFHGQQQKINDQKKGIKLMKNKK